MDWMDDANCLIAPSAELREQWMQPFGRIGGSSINNAAHWSAATGSEAAESPIEAVVMRWWMERVRKG
jgi:hypothetical protein